MPVSIQTPKISYTANGSVTSFSFPFRIIYASDLKVYLNGEQVISGFSITGVDNPTGGDVVFTVAPANGVTVRLQRIVPLERTTDYVEGGQLAAQTMDNDFDRLVMVIQDLDSISFKENSSGSYDMGGRRVENVAAPVNPNDAVTKVYTDSTIPANVSAAAASAAASAASATESYNQAVISNAQAAASTASASTASGYASDANASALAAAVSAADAAAALSTRVEQTSSTGSAILPSGTTAQRDGTPAFGYTRANSTLNQTEWWNGIAWVPMGGGATGGVGNYAFFENDVAISTDYTITTNKNAMTAGPVTINSGVAVTVPSGSVWSIV